MTLVAKGALGAPDVLELLLLRPDLSGCSTDFGLLRGGGTSFHRSCNRVCVLTLGRAAALRTSVGARVARGEVISEVGHTGRATNDHMHLEVHVAPTDSVKFIVDSLNRYPPYTTNPELWITPLPGTGVHLLQLASFPP